MAENNRVGIAGLIRAVFEQEAKAIPKEKGEQSLNKIMAELNKRKQAEHPSLDSKISKCAGMADVRARQAPSPPTNIKEDVCL